LTDNNSNVHESSSTAPDQPIKKDASNKPEGLQNGSNGPKVPRPTQWIIAKIFMVLVGLAFVGVFVYLWLSISYPNLVPSGFGGPVQFLNSTPNSIVLYNNTVKNVSLGLQNNGSIAVQFTIYPDCGGISLPVMPPNGYVYDEAALGTNGFNYTLNSTDYSLLVAKLAKNVTYNCSVTIKSSSTYAGHFSTYGPDYVKNAFKIILH
jgi:hypothetical protein